MFDSVNVAGIPANAAIVAGYMDGRYNNFAAMVARFPAAKHINITVFGAPNVRVCDCETGDLTPAQAAGWAHAEIAAGRRPTIYCNISTHPAVIAALAAYGLEFLRDVDWWAAGYTNSPYLAPGSVATQFEDVGPYDESLTNGYWPDPPAAPLHPPTPTPGPIMTNFSGLAPTKTGKGYWLSQADGNVVCHGDAVAHGTLAKVKLSAPIVAIVATPSGGGYWLVGADGGVFNLGDAKFHGSTGGVHLSAPVVGMVPTVTGNGYWLVGADGGVFNFGDAGFFGSGA